MASAAKEVLQKQDLAFSARHVPNAVHARNHAGHSVLLLPVGTRWRTLRRILNSNIFSSNSLEANEHLRNKKVEKLITYCWKASVSNDYVDIGRREDKSCGLFPVLKKIDPQGIRRRLSGHFGKLLEMFEELIDEGLRMGRLKHNVLLDDLFGAKTTSNTLEWAMVEALRNPDSMTRVKEELEEVIGKAKIVKENDVLRLPYLSCIVKETLRLHPLVPLLIPRKVVKEVQLNGYTIPKGTQVLGNAWAIGRDPTVWDDSLEFKPQRFLKSGFDFRGNDLLMFKIIYGSFCN
ncbi:putative geraniol 8-hydroxylase [Helianthus anomalus]